MLPQKMQAVLLTGFGGLERLKYHKDVPVPHPDPGQVLLNIIVFPLPGGIGMGSLLQLH